MTCRPAPGAPAPTADPDGDPRLDRQRGQRDVVHDQGRPLVDDGLAGQQRPDHVQHLVRQRGALARVHRLARLAVLVRRAADPDPEDQAPAGQPVDRRELPGERHRPLAGDHRDVRPDQQPVRGERGRGDQRPRVARRRPPDEPEVVPDQQRLPPGVLGHPRQVRHPAGLGEVVEVHERQPEPERLGRDALRLGHDALLRRRAGARAASAIACGYLRRFLRSAITSRAALRPGVAVTPPPGCAPEPARYSPSTGIR